MDVVANLILLDVASRTHPDNPPSAEDLSALARAAIAEIDRLRAPGWIKCSDRLPAEGQDVLVFVPKGDWRGIQVAFRYAGEWNLPTEVSHWMPFPAPPDQTDTAI